MRSWANVLQLVVHNDTNRSTSRTFSLSYICSDGEDTDFILLLADVFDYPEIQVWQTDRRNMRFTSPLSTADFIMDHMYTQRYRDIHCTFTNEFNKEIIFHHQPAFEENRPLPTLPPLVPHQCPVDLALNIQQFVMHHLLSLRQMVTPWYQALLFHTVTGAFYIDEVTMIAAATQNLITTTYGTNAENPLIQVHPR
jgi:hypothetical protein